MSDYPSSIKLDFSRERSQQRPNDFLLAVPVSAAMPDHWVRAWQSRLAERLGRSDVDQIENVRSVSLRVVDGEAQIAVGGTEQAIIDCVAQRRLHSAVQDTLDQTITEHA